MMWGNCIIMTMGIDFNHKKKLNRSVYISRIISAYLYYTMPLIIPSGLFVDDSSATLLNSREKAYNDNAHLRNKCDLLSMKMIYEHQQREHINLISDLESIPDNFINYHSTFGFITILLWMFCKRKCMRCYSINVSSICLHKWLKRHTMSLMVSQTSPIWTLMISPNDPLKSKKI